MKVGTLLVIAGLAASGVVASDASGQAATMHLATVERSVGSGSGTLLLDDGELDARLASADRALKRGSIARARTMYESIAVELRAENRLPTPAIWRLAAMEYNEGSPLKAAAMLDGLASEAAAANDLTVQIMSLFEAANVYALEGMSRESEDRLDRGVRLLGGSDLPVETRVALMKKVRG